MSTRLLGALYFSGLTLSCATLGLFFAEHKVAQAIASVRAKGILVCGTGLEIPLVFWTIVGAIFGLVLGNATWRLISKNE